MALTVASVAQDLLGLLGYEGPGNASASVLQRILTDIQTVRESLFLKAGVDRITKESTGALLAAPLTLPNITFTQGAKAMSGAGLTAAMDGCTCMAGADKAQNRLVQTGVSTFTLQAPYNGANTTTAALQIWFDCLPIDPLALSIERPIELENYYELMPLASPAELRASSWSGTVGVPNIGYNDYGRMWNMAAGGYPTVATARQAAPPVAYLIEWFTHYSGIQMPRLRVDPLPDQVYTLRWWQRKIPAPITTITDTTSLLIPHGMDASIFLPMVRLEMADHPQFTGDDRKIAASAQRAERRLLKMSRAQPMKDIFIQNNGF